MMLTDDATSHGRALETARRWLAGLVVWSVLIAAPAAQAAFLSAPTSQIIGGVGSSTTVPISIDSADGVEGADIEILYTSSVVSVTTDATASTITSDCTLVSNITVPGVIRVAIACNAPLSGVGPLFNVAFNSIAQGTAVLTLRTCILNEGSVGCIAQDGSIIVPAPTVTPSLTLTPTRTPTLTPTITRTPTETPTRTYTSTATQTRTATVTRTLTPTRTWTPTRTVPPPPVLDPIGAPIVLGTTVTLTGSGFTAGSRIVGFVGTSQGTQSVGPYTPRVWTPTQLTWDVPLSMPLGQGFAILAIVNTDQNFVGSDYKQALLYGNAAQNRPTILTINGGALHPPDGALPVVYVATPIYPGTVVTIGGTGFNNAGVNFFTAAGNLGPLWPLPGATANQIQVEIPANTPLGLTAFEVVNNPYVGLVGSQTVFVPIGDPPTITAVTQASTTINVTGTNFAQGAVVNFFNTRPSGAVVNLGGFNLVATVASPTQLSFPVPTGATAGQSYVQIVNPPFIGFTSSGNDPDGSFVLGPP